MELAEFIRLGEEKIARLSAITKKEKPIYEIGAQVKVKEDKGEASYINKVIGAGRKGVIETFDNVPLVNFGDNKSYYVRQTHLARIRELTVVIKEPRVRQSPKPKPIPRVKYEKIIKVPAIKESDKYGLEVFELRETGLSYYAIAKILSENEGKIIRNNEVKRYYLRYKRLNKI